MSTKQWTQPECDAANALREYEQANKVYMSTSVFTQAGRDAKLALACARDRYIKTLQMVHPTWIIF